MNIKEHIEAGHYERDEQCGGWSVTLRNHSTAKVFTTKCGGNCPLVGVVSVMSRGWVAIKWNADGTPEGDTSHWSYEWDILPPTPRKVKVTRWLLVPTKSGFMECSGHFATRKDAEEHREHYGLSRSYEAVEMSGEREEPWS